MGCLVYANSQVWFCIWPWVRLLALDLASSCAYFFPFSFLINDSGNSLKHCVCFFYWNYHLRKRLSSKSYWIPPWSMSLFWLHLLPMVAETDYWSFPPICNSGFSSTFCLPVPYSVKVFPSTWFPRETILRTAMSICLACLRVWLYSLIIT